MSSCILKDERKTVFIQLIARIPELNRIAAVIYTEN